jgi:hypothetical protein
MKEFGKVTGAGKADCVLAPRFILRKWLLTIIAVALQSGIHGYKVGVERCRAVNQNSTTHRRAHACHSAQGAAGLVDTELLDTCCLCLLMLPPITCFPTTGQLFWRALPSGWQI